MVALSSPMRRYRYLIVGLLVLLASPPGQPAQALAAAEEAASGDALCEHYGTRPDSVFSIFRCGVGEPVRVDGAATASTTRSPVVLVPGFGGSGLDAQADGDTDKRRPWYCPKRHRKFHVWFNVFEILTKVTQICQVRRSRGSRRAHRAHRDRGPRAPRAPRRV